MSTQTYDYMELHAAATRQLKHLTEKQESCHIKSEILNDGGREPLAMRRYIIAFLFILRSLLSMYNNLPSIDEILGGPHEDSLLLPQIR